MTQIYDLEGRVFATTELKMRGGIKTLKLNIENIK